MRKRVLALILAFSVLGSSVMPTFAGDLPVENPKLEQQEELVESPKFEGEETVVVDGDEQTEGTVDETVTEETGDPEQTNEEVTGDTTETTDPEQTNEEVTGDTAETTDPEQTNEEVTNENGDPEQTNEEITNENGDPEQNNEEITGENGDPGQNEGQPADGENNGELTENINEENVPGSDQPNAKETNENNEDPAEGSQQPAEPAEGQEGENTQEETQQPAEGAQEPEQPADPEQPEVNTVSEEDQALIDRLTYEFGMSEEEIAEALDGGASLEDLVAEKTAAAEAAAQAAEEAAALAALEALRQPVDMVYGDSGKNVTVSGLLPQNLSLEFAQLGLPKPVKSGAKGLKGAKAAPAMAAQPEETEEPAQNWKNLGYYDIKLIEDETNELYTPDGTVTVTLKGLTLTGGELRVLHILDSAEAIAKADAEQMPVTRFSALSADELAASVAAAAAYDGVDDVDYVYVETLEVTDYDEEEGYVTFETGSFSIYLIQEGEQTEVEVPRVKFIFEEFELDSDGSLTSTTIPYEFYNTSGELVDNQILKNGESLDDVGTPIVPDGTTFSGWYIYDATGRAIAPVNFTGTFNVAWGDTKAITVSGDNFNVTVIDNDLPTTDEGYFNETDNVYYIRPYFGNVAMLTFYDNVRGTVILSKVQVPLTDDGEGHLAGTFDFNTIGAATVTDTTVAFVGWTTTDISEYTSAQLAAVDPEYDTSDSLVVTQDMTFYPVFHSGHFIYFVSAPEGSGATYIAPVFVEDGAAASTVKPGTDPTWKNHTFLYWTLEGSTDEFDWSTVPEEDLTLYGRWRADEVKYIISIYKQNVTDDKDASNSEKSYSFFKQFEMTASAGTITVYTPEEYKKLATTDTNNFKGFVYNVNKSDESANLASDGSTNLKLYYDRVTITMNFIGYPGETNTIYNYIALDDNDYTTDPQYGQINGNYKQLVKGDPIERYEYNGYTGTAYTTVNGLYGTNDSGVTYFPVSATVVTSTGDPYLAQGNSGITEYTGTIYTRSPSGWSYSYSPFNGTPQVNTTYYYQSGTDWWGDPTYSQLYWVRSTLTTTTFVNTETNELYGTKVDISYYHRSNNNWSNNAFNTTAGNAPALFTRRTITIYPWYYDGELYYGARYSRSSSGQTGLVYTGLYGQTLEQNGYTWPGTYNGDACYWQYETNQPDTSGNGINGHAVKGMSYLGEFVLPKEVADPNGQIIDLHYSSIDNNSTVYFYLMGTDGKYSDTANDSGTISRGGTFFFSEKYDGFNVAEYRRFYMDGNTRVYVDKDGNAVINGDDAWATAVVDGSTPLFQLVHTGNNTDYYWYYGSGNDVVPVAERYTGTQRTYRYYGGNLENYTYIWQYNGSGSYSMRYDDHYTYYTMYYLTGATPTNSNNGTQYAQVHLGEDGTVGYVELTRGNGSIVEYCNLEIRYSRKQYTLSFVDSLDGHSSLTDSNTNQTIAPQAVYYNEELGEYQPADTVIPKSSSAGYVFKGWFKDQACHTPFDWTENMPNANLQVYAGWEQEWFYVKLIPDGGVLLTSQSTYFWETYGEKVVEYANITKNFVEDAAGPYVYYFGEFDTTFGGTDPVNRDWPQATYRYSLYFTNDGTKVVLLNPDGTLIGESENVTAYRNKVVDGHYVYDDEGNIIQETYPIPASTIYDYGVQNGFIDTSHHYKYERDAYALVGWYDVTDGTRKVYSFAGGVNKDTVLRAVWRKIGEYTFGYSTNGVDSTGAALDPAVTVTAADVPRDTNTYADNSDSAIMGIASNVPSGYAFTGWYYDGHVYQKGDAMTLKASLADEDKVVWLYPVFTKVELLPVATTHIVYNGNGGTTAVTSDEENHIEVNAAKTTITEDALQVNAALTLRGEETFKRNGYEFKGWATTATATVATFAAGAIVGVDNLDPTANTLYAVWEKKTYTVTIQKIVTNGSEEDNDLAFAFSDPAFNPLISAYQGTFSLKNGTSKEYVEVPYGTTFKVQEDSNSIFETSVIYSVANADDTTKNVDNATSSNGATYTVDGDVVVIVTNRKLTANYTVRYYKTEVTNTGDTAHYLGAATLNGTIGSTITVADGTASGQLNFKKPEQGYKNGVQQETNVTIASDGSAVVNVLYAPIEYTIAFDDNTTDPVTGSTASMTMKYDETKALTANGFERTGYTFQGWDDTEGGSTVDYADQASVSNLTATDGATVTLYAVWEPINYKLAYELNGGAIAAAAVYTAASTTMHYKDPVDAPEASEVSRAGYTFGGWYTDSGLETAWTGTEMPASDLTLYAKWTSIEYVATFDVNGGNAMTPNTQTFTIETVVSFTVPTRTGYTFKGWKITEVAADTNWENGKQYAADAAQADAGKYGNVTFTAQWEINQYDLTINYKKANGETAFPTHNETLNFEAEYSVTSPTLDGYTVDKAVVEGTMPAENVTVDVTYTPIEYTATFDENHDNVATYRQTFTIEDIVSFTVPTRTGYTFRGWKITSDVTGTSWTENKQYGPTATQAEANMYGDVTFTAQWAPNLYQVNYIPDGGTAAASYDNPLSYTIEDAIPMPALTKTGYDFLGWKVTAVDDSDTNWVIDTLYGPAVTSVEAGMYGDVYVTAQWDPHTYQVVFTAPDATGGSTESPQSFVYDVAQDLNPNGFERKYVVSFDINYAEGTDPASLTSEYTFKDWKGSDNNTYTDKQNVINLTAVDEATITMTAEWDPAAVTLPTPVRPGWTFDGWFDRAEGGDLIGAAGASYTPTADIELHAHWTQLLGQVTITKNNAKYANETFVYTLESVDLLDDDHNAIFMTVMISVNSSGYGRVTIPDLPYGTYKVTSQDLWSWRYGTEAAQTAEVGAEGHDFPFNNARSNIKWLDGFAYRRKESTAITPDIGS